MATHSSILKSHGQRNLKSCSPLGHTELNTTELLSTHAQVPAARALCPRPIGFLLTIRAQDISEDHLFSFSVIKAVAVDATMSVAKLAVGLFPGACQY